MIINELKKWTETEDITLVAVSKTHSADRIREIYNEGHRDFGENRVQELLRKKKALPDDIRWHQIGPLQSNKIKSIVPFVHLVHSVDRLKVVRYINKEAKKIDRPIDILIQVHIADEETKHGLNYVETDALFNSNLAEKYPYVNFRGLMGMATFTDDEDQIRSEFSGLADYYNKLQSLYPDKLSDFDILSMGMTSDYKIAVECGSNMLRIGRLIFGSRDY